MNLLDLQQIIHLFNITSKDETRPSFNGVYFNGTVWAATNGIALTSYTSQGAFQSQGNFIHNGKLDILKALAKEFKGQDVVPCERIIEHMTVINYSQEVLSTLYHKSTMKYSNLISFDLKSLIALHKSLTGGDKANARKGFVQVCIDEPMKPLLVNVNNGRLGLLAPVRFDAES